MAQSDSDKKLVVTHIVSGDIWAGAEAQAFQLISGLQANGVIKPTVVVFNTGVLLDKLTALGVYVTLADETVLSPLSQVKVIRAHLKQNATDILHTHGFKENVLGTTARYLSGVKHSVLTIHGSPELNPSWRTPKKKLTNLLDRLITGYCYDALVAVSEHLKTLLEPRYGNKVVVIRNFIDTESIPDASQAPRRPRKSGAPFRIGLVGRCVPVKRIDLFIDTIVLLRTRHELDLVGTVCGDGPLLESMKQYAKDQGVTEYIQFKGFVGNMEPEWSAMDALLMPSDHEGLPMTLLEALYRQIPVVAHNAGGIPEVLDYGRCGMLVADHHARGYAEGFLKIIVQDETPITHQILGEEHIKANFSKNKNVKRYEALYQNDFAEAANPAS